MAKYLFVNPTLNPPGGAQGVACWMLQALADCGDVTVLTWSPPNYAQSDRYYGTDLRNANITTLNAAPLLRPLLERLRIPHYLIQHPLLARAARALRAKYPLCFSACNDVDFGSPPAVQYIHFPNTPEPPEKEQLRLPCPWPSNPVASLLWPFYLRLVVRLRKRDLDVVRSNITIANSHWTADVYRGLYGTAVNEVIYPPPLGEPRLATAPRHRGFLSIGRVDRTKNWPELVEIVARLRELGHEVTLTLVGSQEDAALLQEIKQLVAMHSGWLRLILEPSREEVDELIASHEFGIHGMVDEHYGMAVAELVLGGCLTFVHDSGGQVEIVPQMEARYRDRDHAVELLHRVLSDTNLCEQLKAAQAQRRDTLSREQFLCRFKALLKTLDEKGAAV